MNKQKIVLVQFGDPTYSMLSGRYLSGILRSRGYETTIVCIQLSRQQGTGLSWDYGQFDITDAAIKNLLEVSKGSLFIGFTVYSFVAHVVKKIYNAVPGPDRVPIVVGGAHPTLNPYHASFFSDYVCVGDGEKAIVELADKLNNGDISIKNKQDAGICENIFQSRLLRSSVEQPLLTGIESALDSCSLPDYTFESEYHISGDNIDKITLEKAQRCIKSYATFFSRGCANNCSFCAQELIAQRSGFSRRVKAKEVAHFTAELKSLRSKYPWMKNVTFFDPNILSNRRDSLLHVLSGYKEDVGLPLSVIGFTFNSADKDILTAFLDAGMQHVTFGIESAAEKTKKLLNRREGNAQISDIDLLLWQLKNDFYFSVQYDIILDIPWESREDVFESLSFVSKLKGYDYLDIFSLRFFPGTQLYNKALHDGIIRIENIDEEYKKAYRGLRHRYENFLFVLLRDGFLRKGFLLNMATSYFVSGLMERLFKKRGKALFSVYIAVFLRIALLKRKLRRLSSLLRIFGAKKTLIMIKNKLG